MILKKLGKVKAQRTLTSGQMMLVVLTSDYVLLCTTAMILNCELSQLLVSIDLNINL